MSTDDTPAGIPSGIETAALRKLIYRLADVPLDADMNVVEAAEQAVDRMTTLEDRIAAIEGATGINIENAEYQEMSRAAKVKHVRDNLKKKAEEESRNGKAEMDYNAVAALFNHQASPGHAVELAKAAAGYDDDTGESTRQGYEFQKRSGGNNRVVVDLEKLP